MHDHALQSIDKLRWTNVILSSYQCDEELGVYIILEDQIYVLCNCNNNAVPHASLMWL